MRSSWILIALATSFATVARAGEATESTVSHRLTWPYPRFRLGEYVAASVVTASQLALTFGTDRIPQGSWTNGILFDDGIRSALRAGSANGRTHAGAASDPLFFGTMFYPVVVDSLVVPLVFDRGNTDVSFQMLLLDWQAEGLTGLVTLGFHRTVGRARPLLQECNGPGCSPPNSGNYASFISGHTSMSFAGAGLTCAHHQALPLYGNAVADAAACGVTLATATTTGVLRIVADKHWSTDVLAAAMIGFGIGYFLPYGLHYSQFRLGAHGPTLAVLPYGSPDGAGISVMGVQ